jgi:hypothetical protein
VRDLSSTITAAGLKTMFQLPQLQDLFLGSYARHRPTQERLCLTPSTAPQLSQMTCLQSLSLSDCRMAPAALHSLTQLLRLQLCDVVLEGPSAACPGSWCCWKGCSSCRSSLC